MSVESALQVRLVGDTNITDIVSTRIYPARIPQGATLPAMTIQRTSTQHDELINGPGDGQSIASFTLSCWARSEANGFNVVQDLASKVIARLQGFIGASDGEQIRSLSIDNEFDTFHEDNNGNTEGTYQRIVDITVAYDS